jgi:NAD(P)-dependent dehydrogenase (short-subunit alcohol dehydrogenase family)
MTTDKWTTDDMPHQTGRTAVVTGANTGLGLETAKVLAALARPSCSRSATSTRARRPQQRSQRTAPTPMSPSKRLDLSSLDSVREVAAELRAGHDRIDLLINNAGVMYTPRSTTADGFELQFGTNHLGHFVLTGLLLDRLLAAAGSRVVTVSSVGHRIRARINFDDLNSERGYSRIAAYGQSKLANLMFTYELQRRLAQTSATTIAVAAHPGGSNTELVRNSPAPLRALNALLGPLITQSASMGALPTLRAATDPTVLGGQYYGPDGFRELRGHPTVVESSTQSHDTDTQRRLWATSEDLTGVTYPI